MSLTTCLYNISHMTFYFILVSVNTHTHICKVYMGIWIYIYLDFVKIEKKIIKIGN